jgi:hypothetical protein
MKTIGYLDGTDPGMLTRLILAGYETLPISNGWDGHGKPINLLMPYDNISVIVGYLHKFLRLADMRITEAMLSSVKAYEIPLVFIVPTGVHEEARKLVAALGVKHSIADPADAFDTVVKTLA